MGPKSTGLDQMERPILGRRGGNQFLIGPPLPQSSMEEGTILWYGVELSKGDYRGSGDHDWREIL